MLDSSFNLNYLYVLITKSLAFILFFIHSVHPHPHISPTSFSSSPMPTRISRNFLIRYATVMRICEKVDERDVNQVYSVVKRSCIMQRVPSRLNLIPLLSKPMTNFASICDLRIPVLSVANGNYTFVPKFGFG
ncbi:hypothetical protein JHK82_012314 [Glycine max]|nr:hypothetical protein JHK85_012669 [Glycine max]KAG5057331.1 hypothetical protein JHK86_012327 [Glycine max]KAG5154345.1 hypothetical protein JHK82_012314 [Glycine max]